MLTLQDTEQLHKLMAENSYVDTLIKKLLDSHQYTLSRISHEIRNPLTMISGTLQLIEKQHPEVSTYSHWSSIIEDIDYMEKLLEDLSLYNNGTRLNKRSFHTSDFFNHTSLSFASSITEFPVEFTSYIPQDLPDFFGDSVKLKQLFLNLLRNSLEAVSYKGAIHLHITHEHNTIIVKISDDGCGIPQEHLSDIFTPFTTYKSNGTGLGLAIAKSIVTAHKGTISVTSIPLKGTTFTVRLPIEY